MGQEFVQCPLLGCWSRSLGHCLFRVLRLRRCVFRGVPVCSTVYSSLPRPGVESKWTSPADAVLGPQVAVRA